MQTALKPSVGATLRFTWLVASEWSTLLFPAPSRPSTRICLPVPFTCERKGSAPGQPAGAFPPPPELTAAGRPVPARRRREEGGGPGPARRPMPRPPPPRRPPRPAPLRTAPRAAAGCPWPPRARPGPALPCPEVGGVPQLAERLPLQTGRRTCLQRRGPSWALLRTWRYAPVERAWPHPAAGCKFAILPFLFSASTEPSTRRFTKPKELAFSSLAAVLCEYALFFL